MFTRLYFDTSELVAAGWPRLSADLENVFTITTAAVFLPAAVEIELHNRWQRDLEEKTSAMRSRVQSVESHLGTSISVGLPDRAKARDGYLKMVDGLKQKYGLLTVPFTRRPVTEIFEMASLRHPPFKQGKEDVGFRDAVIFLSVVDDLMAVKDQNPLGALVARDEAFHAPKIIEFATKAGVALQVFHSVKEVFDSLINDTVEEVKAQWAATTERVQRSLGARLPEIEKFISDTLGVPPWNLVRGARVILVPRIEVLTVKDARVPNPLEVRGHGRARLSFDVQVKFHAQVEKLDLPQMQPVRIGPEKTLGEILGQSPDATGFGPRTEEVEVPGLVRIEASADPKLREFTFESASLVTEGFGLSGLLATTT